MQEGPGERDYRLDLVKAISICLVLLWHLKPLMFSSAGGAGSLLLAPKYFIAFAERQLMLTAVPMFFIVSLVLYFRKCREKGYLKRRVMRLVRLFAFWTAVQTSVYLAAEFFLSDKGISVSSGVSMKDFVYFGGPPLPIVGDSVFYFFFVLIWLTVLSGVYERCGMGLKRALGLAVAGLSLVYFEVMHLTSHPVPYWRIDSFLIYVPAAYWLSNADDALQGRKYFWAGYLVFSVQDVILALSGETGFVAYARPSIVFGALAITTSILGLQSGRYRNSVKFLSENSLGIFAVHKYWQLFAAVLFAETFSVLNIPGAVSTHAFELNTVNLASATAAAALTLLTARIMRHSPLRRYMS